ncbi:MAG: hypothetical protein KA586_01215 [Candidatus Promineofilum sp.]|nr:hypothetical protein [Promineifilum sp.]
MRKFGILLTIVLLLLLVPAVLAGGWAVVTLDDAPGEIHAGQPWTVGFTVLQHGQTPVHTVYDGIAVEPVLIAIQKGTGERVQATGTPTEEVGHFTLEVTFPSEGEWSWTIEPAPLAGDTKFEPLNVLPAVAAAPLKELPPAQPGASQAAAADSPSPAGATGFPFPVALRWAALLVALAAVGLFVVQLRRRAEPPAGVESR